MRNIKAGDKFRVKGTDEVFTASRVDNYGVWRIVSSKVDEHFPFESDEIEKVLPEEQKPIVIESFPGQTVEEYRLKHGRLPTNDL